MSSFPNGFDLVRCQSCAGNVRIKVPKKESVMAEEETPKEQSLKPDPKMIPVAQVQRAPKGPMIKSPDVSRITVVKTITWQKAGEQPQSMSVSYERITKDVVGKPTNLDPIEVGPDWISIDVSAWPRIALLVVRNTEGKFDIRPTPEEMAAAMSRVLEIGFDDDPTPRLFVAPTETKDFHFADPKSVRFRCPNGPAVVHISVVPG